MVEVNSTFYRPASAKAARSWLSRIEGRPDFRFTAKVWRRFTHERSPFTAADVRAAREGLDILAGAGRLGVALLQFPWSFKRDDASREWLRAVTGALRGRVADLDVRDGKLRARDGNAHHGFHLRKFDCRPRWGAADCPWTQPAGGAGEAKASQG